MHINTGKTITRLNWLVRTFHTVWVETGPAINDILKGNRSSSSNPVIAISDTWTWQVDHIRSAVLWREEGSQKALYPSYGLWRRIDDCVSDALCFWPQRDIIGLLPKRILVAGGWVNGEWSDLWERMYCHWLDRVSGNKKTEYLPAELTEPWLFPLDEPAPSPWISYDCEDLDQVELRGIHRFEGMTYYPPLSGNWKDGVDRYHFLPAGLKIMGFEGYTTYLQTKDKASVVTYSRLDSSGRVRMEDPWFEFLYGDEYITASFTARSGAPQNSKKKYHTWVVENIARKRSIHPRFKESELSPDMVIEEPSSGYPDYQTWIRTSSAIRDAFLEFKGSRLVEKKWSGWLDMVPSDKVSSHFGYCAGRWGGYSCSSRYLADPQTLYNREIHYPE